jgi:HEAT repeat protein
MISFHEYSAMQSEKIKIIMVLLFCMEPVKAEEFDLKKMIADYMENGLLENIIDMFKHDKSLYTYIIDLMTDERMRVRIGAIALLETLKKEDPQNIGKAIQSITPLLKDQNPLIRGDTVYVLGLIGDQSTITLLDEIANDADAGVRVIVKEAIHDIQSNY